MEIARSPVVQQAAAPFIIADQRPDILRPGLSGLWPRLPPSPPPLGQIAAGPDYVIMTLADANPRDWSAAQQLVTDAVFEFLMPRYCALPGSSGVGCVTNRVQWSVETYDAGGNPTISGCAA